MQESFRRRPKKPSRLPAILALILSIVGILLFCMPAVALPCDALAVLLGIIVVRKKLGGVNMAWSAILAALCGATLFVLGFVMCLWQGVNLSAVGPLQAPR